MSILLSFSINLYTGIHQTSEESLKGALCFNPCNNTNCFGRFAEEYIFCPINNGFEASLSLCMTSNGDVLLLIAFVLFQWFGKF